MELQISRYQRLAPSHTGRANKKRNSVAAAIPAPRKQAGVAVPVRADERAAADEQEKTPQREKKKTGSKNAVNTEAETVGSEGWCKSAVRPRDRT